MFRKILYPVDLSHQELAASFAAEVEKIADALGAEIEVMTAVPGFNMAIVASYFPPDAEKRAMREMDKRLKEFAGQAFTRPTKRSIAQGTHWKRIIEVAETRNVDLIVLPHCDKHWPDNLYLGSCAEKVAQRAPCSVLVLRPADRGVCPG